MFVMKKNAMITATYAEKYPIVRGFKAMFPPKAAQDNKSARKINDNGVLLSR